jgi:hypothetical protein
MNWSTSSHNIRKPKKKQEGQKEKKKKRKPLVEGERLAGDQLCAGATIIGVRAFANLIPFSACTSIQMSVQVPSVPVGSGPSGSTA